MKIKYSALAVPRKKAVFKVIGKNKILVAKQYLMHFPSKENAIRWIILMTNT